MVQTGIFCTKIDQKANGNILIFLIKKQLDYCLSGMPVYVLRREVT